MPDKGREVGGLWCIDVLQGLSNYVDGELSAVRLEQIKDHLHGCDWCRRFGDTFLSLVNQLRIQAEAPASLDPDIAHRLHRLIKEL